MPSTHNNVWASNDGTDEVHELTLPSGQTCSAKKVGMEALIESGMLAEADALTALVSRYTHKTLPGGKPKPNDGELDEKAMLRDPRAITAVINLADRVIPSIVIDPPVALHFTERTVGKTKVQTKLTAEQRNEMRADRPDLIFTDQIDFGDKMYLFDFGAGGLKAMTPFRGESSNAVGDVANEPRPARTTKRASRKR